MSTIMAVSLTQQAANAQWGANALLSFSAEGAVIHLMENEQLANIQRAARRLDTQGIKQVELSGEGWDLDRTWAFIQGHRTSKPGNSVVWSALNETDEAELQARIKATEWVREIINQPADVVRPSQLATRAGEFIKSLAPEHVTYKIIKGNDLLDEGWNGIHAVGRGSEHRPAMLRLDYNPTGDANAPVFACLVGKGITFDSGGYSIKPSAGMTAMKADMGGAALATGGLALAMARGLNKRIKLVLCCAENMISGRALKLGDIIKYKNGTTVEILNTDAEGRLVLADGLIYANSQNPELVIDCATLTGAAKMALGNDYHALLSFDAELSHTALTAAAEENEGMWPLPLADLHRNMLPSNYADLANISSGDFMPGASTAAAFLSYFVDDYKKGWMHIDASGTFRKSANDQWSAGATGMGVRTLANILTK
ncbi:MULTISPECIES: aminopeptidase PepB [unclassified Photobacterium]|uniref:aminopeptidase PepB n=1 Tax=unclassified Photobacterium TaxID=2628852 RepID=UPI000D1674AB|nr:MULTISPECIES: aminopeptidase PepB [unclassified Photobacterium]PSV25564.1 aminopeptidase PepB [Photobacterium sp. GB-56]PSV39719.1 aminopeptidase PepB [Photobacterium sp. GB-210]PSV43721.1 aminopeptidase PepB [Photobacterium sp. GB-36]PSV53323.1 aminopeptidase PepB [Photobacterium sp. GB-1]PSW72954.1 aminopeptidase PepB [Photobacterium sp. GB-50]